MRLKVIASGSAGNAYVLYNETSALLIECGVPFMKIKKALDFDLSKVVGCLVTHEHKDHCKGVHDVMKAGITVYATQKTHEEMGTTEHIRNGFVVADGATFRTNGIEGFRVMAFKVKHDAADPVGFLINHPECGTILFATDTYFLKQTFRGLNNVIIEANYCAEKLTRQNEYGNVNQYVSDRVKESHMSIQQCIATLQANDLREVNNIVLIHLSNGNSDEKRFIEMVSDATGKCTHAARANMDIDFNATPF